MGAIKTIAVLLYEGKRGKKNEKCGPQIITMIHNVSVTRALQSKDSIDWSFGGRLVRITCV